MAANTLVEYLLSNDKNKVLKRSNFYHSDATETDLLSPNCKSFLERIAIVADLFYKSISCNNKLVYYYWCYILSFSIFGIMYTFQEVCIAIRNNDSPSTYQGHCYKYITSNRLKRFARLCSSLAMVIVYCCLFYGVIMAEIPMVVPWLVVYSALACLQFCYWFCGIILGRNHLQITDILHFVFVVFNTSVGICLTNSFGHHYIVNECQFLFCQKN